MMINKQVIFEVIKVISLFIFIYGLMYLILYYNNQIPNVNYIPDAPCHMARISIIKQYGLFYNPMEIHHIPVIYEYPPIPSIIPYLLNKIDSRLTPPQLYSLTMLFSLGCFMIILSVLYIYVFKISWKRVVEDVILFLGNGFIFRSYFVVGRMGELIGITFSLPLISLILYIYHKKKQITNNILMMLILSSVISFYAYPAIAILFISFFLILVILKLVKIQLHQVVIFVIIVAILILPYIIQFRNIVLKENIYYTHYIGLTLSKKLIFFVGFVLSLIIITTQSDHKKFFIMTGYCIMVLIIIFVYTLTPIRLIIFDKLKVQTMFSSLLILTILNSNFMERKERTLILIWIELIGLMYLLLVCIINGFIPNLDDILVCNQKVSNIIINFSQQIPENESYIIIPRENKCILNRYFLENPRYRNINAWSNTLEINYEDITKIFTKTLNKKKIDKKVRKEILSILKKYQVKYLISDYKFESISPEYCIEDVCLYKIV